MLLGLAVSLIIYGEPQPSSRPSGKSVVVSGTSPAPIAPPAVLLIRQDRLEYRDKSVVRTVGLPTPARPRQLLTGRGMSVVLAVVDGRQRAYAVTKNLAVTDLGLADGAIAGTGAASVIIETSLTEPGKVYEQPLPSPSRSGSTAGESGSSLALDPSSGGVPPLRNFVARRYDAAAHEIGSPFLLPAGMRLATDSAIGLLVWQPTSRVFDNGVGQESQSALAMLIRPDGSVRIIGPVRPLAADLDNLLVWDIANHRFGLMPLEYVNSTATTTASASPSRLISDPTTVGSKEPSRDLTGSPSASPTTVAGVKWFESTKGFVVSGPASFSPDGSAFAVFASVGARRRLVAAQVSDAGTDQIEVLALVKPVVKPSVPSSYSPGSASSSLPSSSEASASAGPAFEPDGFPIAAPQVPQWWGAVAVAVSSDGAVIGYEPGTNRAAILNVGADKIQALTDAP